MRRLEIPSVTYDLTCTFMYEELVLIKAFLIMHSGVLKVSSGQLQSDGSVLKGDQLADSDLNRDGVVSFYADLPVSLQAAMTSFIERYPNWDQYRLIQAALAGFLVQNGVESREITRLYIGNMFRSESLINGI